MTILIRKFIAVLALLPFMGAVALAADWQATGSGSRYMVVATAPAEPALNTMIGWTLTVNDAAGKPVEGATITVSGGMPAHGHGLPTEPAVTAELGEGHYQLDGVKFSMNGTWVMDFAIVAAAGSETVRIQIQM